MKTVKLTLLAIAFLGLAVSSTFAFPVAIQAGSYAGRYYVNGVGGPFFGDQTVDLQPGTYFLDTGAEIGGSAFTFDVAFDGTVGNVSPPAAATASGTAVTFNNVTITISAGTYVGRYFLSIFGTSVEYHGDQAVVLLPALTYTLDDGAEIANSGFQFSLDSLGTVTTSSQAAFGIGATLSLANTTIQVDPQNYAGIYYLSAFFPTPFTGPQTLTLIRSLQYVVDVGSVVGAEFVFFLDAAGNVSVASGAASASGNVLTFANVLVHVDPTTYTGAYRIGGYFNLQGVTNLVLMPTLAQFVTDGTQNGSLTADICQVTPATLFTFSFSVVHPPASCGPVLGAAIQPPIKSDGSSVFKSNREVVPVKFTLTSNGAATCQLPPATISLIRTSGAAPGIVNPSDYLQRFDNGSNFRIDRCQYVYHLRSSALGTGQYVVQISINNIVVGTATFGLNGASRRDDDRDRLDHDPRASEGAARSNLIP